MNRIAAQVHENLIDLGRVCQDHLAFAQDLLMDFDVDWNRCTHQLQGFLDNGADLYRFSCSRGLARKTHDLPYHVLGPQGGSSDLFQAIFGRIPFRHIVYSQLRVADNDPQDVVELVCDSPGQGAESFDFMGLPQFIFQYLLLRDVVADTENFLDITFLIINGSIGPCNPNPLTVSKPVFILIGNKILGILYDIGNQGFQIPSGRIGFRENGV